ncbi:MAG: zinc-ribbon domain-containing protein [Planctomycetes bacterium]|nr:zinc-ribbon domain-containing protein [Planctomycetota bacterium]
MAIRITCPGCHTRFSVADKFAGQTGPCPKCKTKISIPKPEDEVVIHTPEHSEAGAVGTGGRHALKTYRRQDTRFLPLVFTSVVGFVLVALLIALVLRSVEGQPNKIVTVLAAIVLGPPLAWAGYTFLRDPELEGYRGTNLILRSLACGLAYALLWGVWMFVGGYVGGPDAFTKGMEIYQLVILGVLVLGIGTFAAYVSFDLDPGSGFFHAALYFGVSILLRLAAGLIALPGLGLGA